MNFFYSFLPTGIYADIAVSQHEHWSSLAPLPFEVVISAGQKAKEKSWNSGKSYHCNGKPSFMSFTSLFAFLCLTSIGFYSS